MGCCTQLRLGIIAILRQRTSRCRGFFLEGALTDNIVRFPKKPIPAEDDEAQLEKIGLAMEKAFDAAEDIYEGGKMVSLGIVGLYTDKDGQLTTKSWLIPGFAPSEFCLALWNAHYSLAKELLYHEDDTDEIIH